MEIVIRRIEQGVVKMLLFPFDREEPLELLACGLCKGKVIGSLVRLKYSQEEVEALLCEYMACPTDKAAKQAFDADGLSARMRGGS
ncbi:hypothetical protein [Hoylesella shahii]|uniref:hypothetical protein n=1 Tax=Hoylesella shahii TaxID=228603 RepID=UPI000470EFC2|nr:hypothetical protein [Hoylesella shahii]